MKRTYTKRDESYWENRKNKSVASAPVVIHAAAQPAAPTQIVPFPDVSYAACDTGNSPAIRGQQLNAPGVAQNAFQNLRSLPLPYGMWNGAREYTGMGDSIELCTRAWASIAVVRNAIEVSVEFSSQPLYIKCENATVKKFFQEWFHAIQIDKLKQQFFREYYRSGNVFLYKFDGKFGPSYYKNFQTSFAAKNNRVPIRYELLNPGNVFVPTGLVAQSTYVRLLSTYDIARLQNPLTEQDKQVFDSLPDNVKSQIKNSGTGSTIGIYIPLDPHRLRFAFYKKQSYEPLAVPMVWPVLPDIEWKLTLTKMDKALAMSVEHILLLVTTGEAPNQWNGGNGINQHNIARLQSVFGNQSLMRVLVADYSTKAEFKVPDLAGLNPEKYQIVNENIKEGLQSILTGDDKFANAQIKAKIFIQRLDEGQDAFLNDFLMPEIVRICDDLGFRTIPTVGFRKINLQDEGVQSRVISQLGQLGILTAPQVVNALETGEMPDEKEMEKAQIKYVKDREDGKYLPLVGGTQKEDGEEGGAVGGGGRPAGTGVKKTSTKTGPIGTSKGSFSMAAIVDTMRASSNLEDAVVAELKKRFKVANLNDVQQGVAHTLTRNIMAVHPKEKWTAKGLVKKCVEAPPAIAAAVMEELDELREEYRLADDFEAAVLRVSRA